MEWGGIEQNKIKQVLNINRMIKYNKINKYKMNKNKINSDKLKYLK